MPELAALPETQNGMVKKQTAALIALQAVIASGCENIMEWWTQGCQLGHLMLFEISN